MKWARVAKFQPKRCGSLRPCCYIEKRRGSQGSKESLYVSLTRPKFSVTNIISRTAPVLMLYFVFLLFAAWAPYLPLPTRGRKGGDGTTAWMGNLCCCDCPAYVRNKEIVYNAFKRDAVRDVAIPTLTKTIIKKKRPHVCLSLAWRRPPRENRETRTPKIILSTDH